MYYGVELVDVHLRKVSLRKAGVYIDRLPPESATMTALRQDVQDQPGVRPEYDSDTVRWSAQEMLIAQLIDEIRVLRYVVTCFASGKGQKVPFPEPVPRPGIKQGRQDTGRRRYTPEQVRRLDPRLSPGTGHTFPGGAPNA